MNYFAWLVTALQVGACLTFLVQGKPYDATYWLACALANGAMLTK